MQSSRANRTKPFQCIMSAVTRCIPFRRPVKEKPKNDVQAQLSDDHKSMHIETPRLIIQPVTRDDADAYNKIFCDKDAMKLYQNGDVKTEDWVKTRLDSWAKRWEQGYPYSGMKVQLKNNDGTAGEVIGHVVCGNDTKEGVSEMAFAFKPKTDDGNTVWNKGFGTEAVRAMVNHGVPLLYAHAPITSGSTSQEKKSAPLKKIIATARPENEASCKILEKVFNGGMEHARSGTAENQYRDARNIYQHFVPASETIDT